VQGAAIGGAKKSLAYRKKKKGKKNRRSSLRKKIQSQARGERGRIGEKIFVERERFASKGRPEPKKPK